MSDLKKRLSEPTHIYYDINVYNKFSPSSVALKLDFSESRNVPFVNKANDYLLSIVRFQTDTSSLPSYNVIPLPGNAPNKLIYSITLELVARNTGAITGVYQEYLTWEPENKNARLGDEDYYWGNSLSHFTLLINKAIDAANMALYGNGNDHIICNYNTDDSKLEVYGLYYNLADNGALPLSNVITKIYFNRELQSLFSTLSYERYNTATLGRFYRLKFDWYFSTIKFNGNQDYILNKQEYETSANISPVSSIVFTSPTMPCVYNQLSNPAIYENNVKVTNSSNSNFFPIITDIQVNEQFYKSNILYVPNAQYRYIDLISNSGINNIDIQCYWRHKDGTFYPLYLYSGMSASLKLLFEKKETEYLIATD